MKTTTVKASELGTNCWLPARFIEGARCSRVMPCQHPEKKTCKAVDAEIAHIKQNLAGLVKNAREQVFQLERERVDIV